MPSIARCTSIGARSIRRFSFGLALLLGVALVANAGELGRTVKIAIPAQPLASALRTLAKQADIQIMFAPGIAAGINAPAVSGAMSARRALDLLLKTTGLEFKADGPDTVVVRRPLQSTASQPVPGTNTDGVAIAGTLQEVVVTAQKRPEIVRYVPMSISVVTSSDLAASHVGSYEDLSRVVPNLSFSTLGGEGLSNLQIRGISSQAGTATVATYIDDVSLTTRNLYSEGAPEPRVFDLQRIEVLRGPQGTLYGASALGGVVRFITNQPVLNKFSGDAFAEGAGVSHGGTDWDLRGTVNIPLATDRAALRLGVERGVEGGYVNVLPLLPGGHEISNSNRNDWTVSHVALLLELTDNLSVNAALFYQRYHTSDDDVVALSPNTPGPYYVTKGLLEPGTDTFALPSVTVHWDAGFADLTAVTAFYHRNFERVNDLTVGNSESLASGPVSNPALAAVVFKLPSADYLNTKVNQFSEEVRLESKPYSSGDSLPVTWLVGGFFSNDDTHLFDEQPIFGINAAFAQFGADPQNPGDLSGGFPGDFVNDLSYLATRNYHTRQYAGFGQATYHFSDALRLTAGFRYQTAREEFNHMANFYYSACDPSLNGPGCPATDYASGRFHALTPKLALDWDISPDVTLYGNITKGFRLGSENRPVPLYGDPNLNPNSPGVNSTRADLRYLGLTTVPASFRPDSLWNYELGTKSALFDRHLLLDVSAFFIKWSDIQQTINLISSGYNFQANAGSATSKGVEFAAKALLPAGFSVDASAGYTKATLDSGIVINGVVVNDTFAGEDVPGVPRWNGNFAAEYQFTVASALLFVRGEADFTGSSHGTLVTTDPDYTRPYYSLFQASAGATIGRYDFSIFAKNLTDDDKIIQRPNILNAGYDEGYRIAPRTIGANVHVNF
jgi:outer membrane receptor protein involved in Fe transport